MAISNLEDALKEGLKHHQSGRLSEAERVYREILSADPNHASAMHLLGALAHQAGRSDAGAQLIEKAIALGHRNVEAFNNLGECYRCLKNYSQAVEAYQAGLRINGNHAETLSNLGLVLNTLGRHGESLPLLERAVRLAPGLANAHCNYGVSLLNNQRVDDAIVQWEQTLKLQPDHPLALKCLGTAYQQRSRFADAVAVLGKLVEKHPDFAEGQAIYSNALASVGRFDDAISAAKRAIELVPRHPSAHNALGAVYMQAERLEEAMAAFLRAAELNPRYHAAVGNIGIIHFRQGRHAEAIEWCERAEEIEPGNLTNCVTLYVLYFHKPDPAKALEVMDRALRRFPKLANLHFNRALALLALGRYLEGFEEYEWRRETTEFAVNPRRLPKPAWEGSDIRDKTILLHCEQGFGDIFHFARYVPMVVATGAKVIVEATSDVLEVLKSIPGVSQFIRTGPILPDFDYHSPILSLPRIFKTTVESIPSKVPYLFADPKRVAHWKPIIDAHASGLKVGMVWGGSAVPDPHRSASIKALLPLAGVPNIRWYSLQLGEHREQLNDAPQMNILDIGKDIKDFADTAAVMSQLDLVITIDTASAHLSGALGMKTWLMLPYITDWRWFLKEDTSPWYPTMRLFRQQSRNDWTSVIEQIRTELLNLTASSR